MHMSEESARTALLLNNSTLLTTSRTPPASSISPELLAPLELPCRDALGRLLAHLTTTEVPSLTLSPPSLPPPETEAHLRHRLLVSENAEVGIMFASKPIVQALTNLAVGPLTNKIGYSWPLFAGLILLFLSTMGSFLCFIIFIF